MQAATLVAGAALGRSPHSPVLPDSSLTEATSASVDVGTLPEVQLVSKRTGPEGSAAHALRRPHLAGRVCAELRARSKNEATR